jgi:hypothetical protein
MRVRLTGEFCGIRPTIDAQAGKLPPAAALSSAMDGEEIYGRGGPSRLL